VTDTAHKTPVIWITGASTGIGRELALRYAREGSVVAASARSADKLSALASENKNIRAYPVDVTDQAAVAAAARAIEAELGPIELAVLNAGIWHPMTASNYDLAKVHESTAINYGGVVNALGPVMSSMIARGRGHIALVASVAGYRGLPKGAAYAPTKAAIISLAETLAADLKLKGVTMTVVNPGFVATPMTAVNNFPMPFLISEKEAVDAIVAGLAKRKFEVVFPTKMAIMMKSLRVLPYSLYFWLTGKISAREGQSDARAAAAKQAKS
jgi:short-subunit dehydrogenase